MSGTMIPRTVQMAKEVATNIFSSSELDQYGNIILNGYITPATAVATSGAVGAIDSLTITTQGTGYTDGTYTNLYIGGPTGSFGYANVTVAAGGVTVATVVTGGQNYFVGETVTVSGIGPGSGLELTVAAVNQNNIRPALKGWTTNYQEYYTAPNVAGGYSVKPGDPTMFSFSVHSFTPPNGEITNIGPISGGSGYGPGTYLGVNLIGNGTGATADIVVGASGAVTSVTVVSGGTGYQQWQTITASAGDLGGTGSGFFAYINTINVLAGGEPRWAQCPRRFYQNQVAPTDQGPTVNNSQAIQYSFMYPVADNLTPPPIDIVIP